jgi:hypothetical protein
VLPEVLVDVLERAVRSFWVQQPDERYECGVEHSPSGAGSVSSLLNVNRAGLGNIHDVELPCEGLDADGSDLHDDEVACHSC